MGSQKWPNSKTRETSGEKWSKVRYCFRVNICSDWRSYFSVYVEEFVNISDFSVFLVLLKWKWSLQPIKIKSNEIRTLAPLAITYNSNWQYLCKQYLLTSSLRLISCNGQWLKIKTLPIYIEKLTQLWNSWEMLQIDVTKWPKLLVRYQSVFTNKKSK